jgi:prophage regulatory protein
MEGSLTVQQMSETKNGPRRMLSIEEVLEIVPVGKSTLFRMVKAGQFPKGKLISPNRRVWYADQVEQWQGDLPVDRTPRRRRSAR